MVQTLKTCAATEEERGRALSFENSLVVTRPHLVERDASIFTTNFSFGSAGRRHLLHNLSDSRNNSFHQAPLGVEIINEWASRDKAFLVKRTETKLNSQREICTELWNGGKVWVGCASVCQKDQVTRGDCKLMRAKSIDSNVALCPCGDTVPNSIFHTDKYIHVFKDWRQNHFVNRGLQQHDSFAY